MTIKLTKKLKNYAQTNKQKSRQIYKKLTAFKPAMRNPVQVKI